LPSGRVGARLPLGSCIFGGESRDGQNLTQKVLQAHLVGGRLSPGEEVAIRVDHVLLQDATGTMAMLEFEALGLPRVRAELCVQYVDHNLLQTRLQERRRPPVPPDRLRPLRSALQPAGKTASPTRSTWSGSGRPGKTMIGADSHTPGAAGLSMLAIGAGGLDAALAMAGYPYHLRCPSVLGVKLTGRLPDWVSAKDVILELLCRRG